MKDFIKRRKSLFIVLGVIVLVVLSIISYPIRMDIIYSINDCKFEPGVYEHYDVAVEYLTTNEEIKEQYGEDFRFYLDEMEYWNNLKSEGETEVSFWIKGRRHVTIYLEYQDGEWVVVDIPRKWRH